MCVFVMTHTEHHPSADQRTVQILFVIPPSENFQSDYDTDQLLCYCKYGTKLENDGQLCVNDQGCSTIIKLGNKLNHEAQCKFNPANTRFDEDGFVMFSGSQSPTFSSPSYQSIDSLPFSPSSSSPSSHSHSHSSSSSFSSSSSSSNSSSGSRLNSPSKSPNKSPFSLSDDHSTSTTSTTSTSSSSSSSTSLSSPFREHVEDHPLANNNNQLWESSTQMFFCNRFCPNKELGCMFFANSEDNIQYHLEHECQAERMKLRISQLETIIEKRETEIVQLRKSSTFFSSSPMLLDHNRHNTSINNSLQHHYHNSSGGNFNVSGHLSSNKNNQISNSNQFSSILLFILKSIKKSISKGIQKLKRFFKNSSSSSSSSSYSSSPYEALF
ncbi:hypothetical protein DFA_03814 [Cavenderia fasciculata]|uniref:Uncharacterized protein n=1 Tax=Cavenderia fasciculata TaxID=261658 RepID=F4Q0G9_CACFS|nr:uncharacterized protein DFA_03814 [Cavenderia fasciculata]EGG18320.1 hypothetical protein DFA_03814 [Cavenderia fasciculata]|eukprot:XP_004366224.1 hypothetical protein DFA_03814 [Cavenderia fasciculata]